MFNNVTGTTTMDITKRNNLIGFIGAILLIVSVFAPVVNKPFGGDMSFIAKWSGSGVLLLLLGFLSGVITFFGKAKLLWLPAILATIILFYHLFVLNGQIDDFTLGNSFFKASFKSVYSMQWGWIPLFVSVAVLFAAVALDRGRK
jgi:hypothetical protein